MSTDGSSKGSPEQQRTGHTGDGMVVLSYVLAGIVLYGGLGWLGDRYFDTSWLLPLGLILGMALSIYMVIKRYGSA